MDSCNASWYQVWWWWEEQSVGLQECSGSTMLVKEKRRPFGTDYLRALAANDFIARVD